MEKRPAKTILLVEHDFDQARLIREMFNHGSHSFGLAHVECMADAEAYLASDRTDVVLLDLGCPDAPGPEGIRRTRATAPHASIVLLAEAKDEAIAMHAMEEDVEDYFIKGQIEPHELMHVVRASISHKVFEEAASQEKNRAQLTLDCIGDAVICTDIAGKVSFLNPVAERMTGWSLSEAVGRPLAECFRIMDAATGEVAADPTRGVIGQTQTGQLPVYCILTRRDGHQIFIEDSVAPILDATGQPAGFVLVFRDVTIARTLADQLTHRAEHDSLTGLPNRLLLNDRLGQAIAQARRKTGLVAVLFLDLNGFKNINDSFGHPTGDKVLECVGRRLQGCVRAPDTVCRHGGDEFVVLLLDLQYAEDASIMSTRILKVIAEPLNLGGQEFHVTASVGVSIYPNDGMDAETLIKNADTAMYQAKASGRRGFAFFKKEMNVPSAARQSIEEDLCHALERDELALHYQPIVNLKSGAITGAEALLRWTHPTRGAVPPDVFIPVAEDSGLILPIGKWVLREACQQAKGWMDAGRPAMSVSVNVSARQFRSDGFLEDLSAVLEETGLSPEFLNIEVTETVLMERAQFGVPMLKTLRDRGLQVAIDDFGTGYSNLSYLQLLPLDVLKIDRSFVSQITTNPDGKTIVGAIIAMGRSLNLRVIAEGIEHGEDVPFLQNAACDEAQGFFFAPPVSADEFAKLPKMRVS